MGKKAVYVVCILAVISCFFQVVGSFLPQFLFSITTLPHFSVWLTFEVQYFAITLEVPAEKNFDDGFNAYTEAAHTEAAQAQAKWYEIGKNIKNKKDDIKNGLKGGKKHLENVVNTMCTPGLNWLAPSMCLSFEYAWSFGIVLYGILVINLLCQGISCFLLYDYATRKRNPVYRETAAGLTMACALLSCIGHLMYFFMVVLNAGSSFSLLQLVNLNTVPARGLFYGIFGTVIQLIQCCVVMMLTVDEYGEQVYLADKEARELELELYSGDPAYHEGVTYSPGMVAGPALQPQFGEAMYPPGMVVNQPVQLQFMASGDLTHLGAAAW